MVACANAPGQLPRTLVVSESPFCQGHGFGVTLGTFFAGWPRERLWRVSSGGWFFVDQVLGKHELITYALALEPDGRVRGIEILEYREAHGGEVRNANGRAQFVGKTAGDRLELDRDIANISGATLSCRHVTDGVKRLLRLYERELRPH